MQNSLTDEQIREIYLQAQHQYDVQDVYEYLEETLEMTEDEIDAISEEEIEKIANLYREIRDDDGSWVPAMEEAVKWFNVSQKR